MKKLMSLFLAIFMLGGLSMTGVAEAGMNKEEMKQKLRSDSYFERAPVKLLHGLSNAAFGWTKLPRRIKYELEQKNTTIFHGIGYGTVDLFEYTLGGVFDAAAFWIPGELGKKVALDKCVFDDQF